MDFLFCVVKYKKQKVNKNIGIHWDADWHILHECFGLVDLLITERKNTAFFRWLIRIILKC